MGSCACFNKLTEDNEITNEGIEKNGSTIKLKKKNSSLPLKYNEKILKAIEQKLINENITYEKLTEAEFNEILAINDNAIKLYEEYEEQLDDLSLMDEPKINNYEMPPIRYINNNIQGSIEYYQGEYDENGYFSGLGTYITKDMDVYFGQFKNDVYDGKGLLITHNGNSIFGNWVDGECNGKGILKIVSGLKYTGEFVNNKKNGKGKEEYMDGSTFEGEFKNGIKSGYGKFQFSNGQIYEGYFENDLYNGVGKYEWPEEKRKYEGEFVNNNMEGNGINTYGDGSKYEGHYLSGLKHGRGTYTWPDGTKFTGNWINNEIHGKGYYENNNEKFEITFRFGKLISSKYSENKNLIKVNFGIDCIIYKNSEDKKNLICEICNNLLNNPYQCKSCYNNYCLDCIHKNDNSFECPNCQKSEFELNLYLLHELVTSVKVNCEKCNKELDYKKAINHFHKK